MLLFLSSLVMMLVLWGGGGGVVVCLLLPRAKPRRNIDGQRMRMDVRRRMRRVW